MGAYLSAPVTEKETFEGKGTTVTYGGSSMQGWRRTMEDAHLADVAVNSDPNTAVFAVFDGHGGAEVAKFCQKYLAQEMSRLKEFEDGSIETSLVKVFHKIDDMLRDGRYADELESLKTKEPNDEEDGGEEGDGVSTMDALDLLKRVFQLKRFMGDGGAPANAAAGANAVAAGSAPGNTNSSGLPLNGADEPGGPAALAPTGPRPMDVESPGEAEEPTVQAGCTAVVAVKRNNELYVANAGDSRGVLCRAGKAVALSEDHKPAQEGERMRIIAAGGFLSEIGGVCRVNGNLNLSRAIGDLKYKSNSELPAKDQIITAQPDIMRITLVPEDRFFLLACDGVWDVMSNQDAVDFLSNKLDQGMSAAQASCALLDACLANDPKEARGVGCDNMTAVVVLLNNHMQPQDGAATGASPAGPPAGGTQP